MDRAPIKVRLMQMPVGGTAFPPSLSSVPIGVAGLPLWLFDRLDR